MKRDWMKFYGYGDKDPILLPLMKGGYFNRNFKNNECVSAHCNNTIHVVYISKSGFVNNGYCEIDAREYVLHNAIRLENTKGSWFTLSNGKLQPFYWEIDSLKTIKELLANPKTNIKKIDNIIENKKQKIKQVKRDFNHGK